jgi:saccharopine dehydrogenase-like NADP-dependent oxidoreductase
MSDKILVVGGYGGAGHHVTRDLLARYGERVIVAGRSSAWAARLAQALDAAFEFRYVDVSDPRTVSEAMTDVGLAIVCVDQPAPYVQEAAIARGAHCLDISAHPRHLRAVRALHDRAVKAGSTILLTGFMPGISGVMGRYAKESMARLDSLDIALCLAWEGESGPAGVRYFLEDLFLEPVPIVEDGKVRHVPALSHGRRVEFLSPLGVKATYLLSLPDQTILPETLGVPVTCRFTFDNVAVTNALAWLAKLGLWRTLDQLGYLPKVASFVSSFLASRPQPDCTGLRPAKRWTANCPTPELSG